MVLSSSSPLVLGGGTLDDIGTSRGAQAFAGSSVFAGASAVTTTSGIGHSLALGALSRNVGGTVNFMPTSTTSTGEITTTTTNTERNSIGGWAILQHLISPAAAWAMSGSSGTSPIAGYSAGSPISGTGSLLTGATINYVVTANATDTGATQSANTIQFGNTSTATTLTASNLSISTGGILVPSTVASATAITGGTLTGPAGNTLANDMIVNQYSASPLTIGSAIINGGAAGTTNTTLTLSGPGTTILTAQNSYTGGTFLNSGTLQIANGGSLGGGNVVTGPSAVLAFNRSDNVLVVGNVITGGGAVQQIGAGLTTISGANTYSGGTTISTGTLRVANTSGSATGSGVVAVSGALAGPIAEGQGFIAGPVNVASGGSISTNDTTAGMTLTLSGGLTLAGGSSASFLLNSASPNGTSNPLVTLGGSSLTVGGSSTVAMSFSGSSVAGTYDLFGYGAGSSGFGAANASGSSIGNLTLNTAGDPSGFTYALVNNTSGSQIDLSVVSNGPVIGSATWTLSSDGNWGTAANWAADVGGGPAFPDSAGQKATFGNSGSSAKVTVTLDTNHTVGKLVFNSSTTAYTLTANQLNLDNSGAGASVMVASAAAEPMIQSTLALNDSSALATFNIAAGAALDIAGQIIDGPNAGQQTKLTGGGTLQLDNANNTYSGGTTVQNGSLTISSTGTLGSGALTFNPAGVTDSAIVTVQNSVQLNNLSQQVSSLGSAQFNVGPSANVTLNQTASASFGGVVNLGAGSTLTVQQNSTSLLSIGAAPSFGSSSTLAIKSGTVAFSTGATNATVSDSTARVTVAAGATLQLVGSALALSSGANSASLANDGTFQIVGASNQTVGVVSSLSPPTTDTNGAAAYTGETIVGDGTNPATLVVSQILQNSLVINAGSTVAILPQTVASDDANAAIAVDSTVASAVSASVSSPKVNDEADLLATIREAASTGAISPSTEVALENRLAVIERLSASDPNLDTSFLESRILALLPTNADLPSIGELPGFNANAEFAATGSGDSVASVEAIAGADFSANGIAAVPGFNMLPVPEPGSLFLAAVGALAELLVVLLAGNQWRSFR